jgi:nucleotidyltransferase/DNA polymerase involved in DNA repair
MRIGCLLMPHFALACERSEGAPYGPGLGADPQHSGGARRSTTVAIVEERVICEVSPAARRYGVWPGQRLQEAFAACPYLVTIEARLGHYERRFQIILDRLAEIAPAVEAGSLGVAYVDVDGLRRHYPDSAQLQSRLLGCAQAELRPRLGIAPGKFPAFVVASRLKPGAASELEATNVPAMLSEIDVDLLPVDQRMIRRLHQLGLHTLGALSALPRHAVAAQFGPEGALAWDLASGQDQAAVRVASVEESIEVNQAFIDPLSSRELVMAATEQVLGRAVRALTDRRQAARLATLRIDLERGKVWQKQITFKEPRAVQSAIWQALRPVVETADLVAPVVSMQLSLTKLTSVIGWQGTLWTSQRRQRQERVQEALQQLKARYGACPVGRIVEVEPWSRIPERRAAIVAFDP